MPTGLEPKPQGEEPGRRRALFYAIEKNNLVYAQKVLSMNFDPNLHHDNGYTPLAYAAMKGSLPMVELLLRNGADPTQTTKEGDTPVELALRFGHAEVADMLKRARQADATDAAAGAAGQRSAPQAGKPSRLAPLLYNHTSMDIQLRTAAEQEICRDTLLEKYAKGEEGSIGEVRRRVARALAQAEAEDERALLGAALPAGAGGRLHPRRAHQFRRRRRSCRRR